MSERQVEQTYARDLREWVRQIISEDTLPLSQDRIEIARDKRVHPTICWSSSLSHLHAADLTRSLEGLVGVGIQKQVPTIFNPKYVVHQYESRPSRIVKVLREYWCALPSLIP